MQVIKQHGLHTLNEQQLLDLIRYSGGAQYDDKQVALMEKKEKEILKAAKEMADREAEEEKLRQRKAAVLERSGAPAK